MRNLHLYLNVTDPGPKRREEKKRKERKRKGGTGKENTRPKISDTEYQGKSRTYTLISTESTKEQRCIETFWVSQIPVPITQQPKNKDQNIVKKGNQKPELRNSTKKQILNKEINNSQTGTSRIDARGRRRKGNRSKILDWKPAHSFPYLSKRKLTYIHYKEPCYRYCLLRT